MNTIRLASGSEVRVPVRHAGGAALLDRLRELNPGASARDLSVAARTLATPAAPVSRRFNAKPRPAPVGPLMEVGRGEGGNGSLPGGERLIVNRPPRSARERRELADALTDAVRGVARL